MPQPLSPPRPGALARLNPLRGLARPREVLAWSLYDLANQSFTLLIITLLFPLYFKQVVVGDPQRGDALWSVAGATSLAIVVLASPLVGAMADARGTRKRMLVLTGIVAATATLALGLIGPGMVLPAIAIFVIGNLFYQVGENFLASFLPDVSTPRTIGRVSALGWTMGYVGALLLLVLTAVLMKTLGWADPSHWQPFFLIAGLWFALGILPAAIILKERQPPATTREPLLRAARTRLAETVRSAGRYRELVKFLTAFFVYALGVQAIIYFAAILAQDFGFGQTKLVLFMLQLTITAGIGAAGTGLFQDRIGAKKTVAIFLVVWIVSCAAMATLALLPHRPEWLFWVIGNGLGLALGGIGTASRAMVGRFTPAHKTAEFFGLWGMVYKGAGVVGVLSFGQVKAWIGTGTSLLLLVVFFAVGLVLVKRVNELAGVRTARRTERDHLAAITPSGGMPRDAHAR